MKKLIFTFSLIAGGSLYCIGQVAISDTTISTDPTSIKSCVILQINSEDKGLLIPRAEKESIDATTGNATTSGMMTYDPSENTFYLKTDEGWIKLH